MHPSFQWSLSVLLPAMLLSCGAKRLDYEPSPTLEADRARGIVVATIERQPAAYAPLEVEALEEKLEVTVNRTARPFSPSGGTVVPDRIVLYYRDIGKVTLSKGKRYFVAHIWDKSGVFKLRVEIREEAEAKAFVDALASLSRAATAEPVDE